MSAAPQDYKNHARFDPIYHYVLAPIMLLNLLFTCFVFFRHHETHRDAIVHGWIVIMALALLILTVKSRSYPLKAQDRIIRLEEQIRLQTLGVSKDTISKLTIDQFCGLRFAPDAEAPGLAALAVTEHLNRKQIKEKITNWRADNSRV